MTCAVYALVSTELQLICVVMQLMHSNVRPVAAFQGEELQLCHTRSQGGDSCPRCIRVAVCPIMCYVRVPSDLKQEPKHITSRLQVKERYIDHMRACIS